MHWEKNHPTIREIKTFELPAYEEIPDVGLYLKQVARYISGHLAPLGQGEVTGSMISNYVKKGLVDKPVKKQYYRDQIAHLIFIAVAKTILSIENISRLIDIQQETYDTKTAYLFLCRSLKNQLDSVFDIEAPPGTAPSPRRAEEAPEKILLRNIVVAIAHKIYVEKSLQALNGDALG
ncbi:DUF1836 domain-containing protein [Pseudoramibacter alactolyticus]|jgi:hypothetical protein|uniref:DUF1836 domain-containing protein n=1 Tax=Pseudoramibacter alactolyticus TaxID=113287 RepID=UPI0028E5522E|nr:DUF1836 domain-containing protein [Pseudoramibacter alactolyticus]